MLVESNFSNDKESTGDFHSDGTACLTCNATGHVSECVICCKQANLVQLMKNSQHESACLDCLRNMYVEMAQHNVGNYPLKCFHPSCGLLIRDTCLKEKGITCSNEEIAKHYQLTTLAKVYRHLDAVAVHCPHCNQPCIVNWNTVAKGLHIFHCFNCAMQFASDPHDTLGYNLRKMLDDVSFNFQGGMGSLS